MKERKKSRLLHFSIAPSSTTSFTGSTWIFYIAGTANISVKLLGGYF